MKEQDVGERNPIKYPAYSHAVKSSDLEVSFPLVWSAPGSALVPVPIAADPIAAAQLAKKY